MKLLLTTPKHFQVSYVINPHMTPGEVDADLVQSQWDSLKSLYEMIGCSIELIEGAEGLPDMVFCANQSFPFYKDGKYQVILSNMFAKERQAEPAHFENWYMEHGYTHIHELPEDICFEAMGDMIHSGDKQFLWGGHGFRTDVRAYDFVEDITGKEVKRLKLVSEHGYHLDVCLCVINERTAMAYKPAFDEASWKLIQENIEDLIELSHEDMMNFAANAFSPDGKNVLMQAGCEEASDALRARGLVVHDVDTSEFMKAGGSVFCMKLELPE